MKAVFDTNILIDYLNGVEDAADELSLYDDKLISIITYIEVMVGVSDPEEASIVRGFLNTFTIKELSSAIANESIRLRQQCRMKVPDAIVYATAKVEGTFIVSRNTKDMRPEWPDVRVPYKT
jgi:predicted nucleic acid-binding protein